MTTAQRRPRGTEWRSGTSLTPELWRELSGFVAAWRFLQMAAASEWRASLEVIKLHGATRGREVARLDEPDSDDQDADITPDDVAAVIRVRRAHTLGDGGDVDGHTNGRAADANGTSEVVE